MCLPSGWEERGLLEAVEVLVVVPDSMKPLAFPYGGRAFARRFLTSVLTQPFDVLLSPGATTGEEAAVGLGRTLVQVPLLYTVLS